MITSYIDLALSSLPWYSTKSPPPQSCMVSSKSPESAAAPVPTYSVCSSYWYVQIVVHLPSFYDLNLPPAGHCLYLPHFNTPIQRNLTHGHWSGDADIEGSKGSVLHATERDRAVRCGVPACLAHATVVWCRAMGRPPE
jgi:hypothetical protein